MSWNEGADVVDELIDAARVVRLRGAGHGVRGLMSRARQQLVSAASLVETDPATAYVVGYDAVKHAALALLAEQELRPTASGGHLALEQVLVAQFKGVFDGFGRMRRRRNELAYPAGPDDFADNAEAIKGVETATAMVEDAQRLLDQGVLTVF